MNESNLQIQQTVTSNVTLFYSNYSANCKALIQRIKSLNLRSKLSIKYINIDNKSIRSIVTKKFDVVPTIVVLLNDEVSLYTGTNAFEWFNIFKDNMIEEHHIENVPSIVRNEVLQQESTNSKKSVTEIAAEFSKIREQTIPLNNALGSKI